MPKTPWALAIAGLWLGGFHFGNCEPAVVPPAKFAIKSWESGLPSSSVIALAQTRDGYLWLGTFDGLARFDGDRFTVFDESETPGLNSGPVVFLFGDSQGNLWVGTDTQGTKLIKDGQVRSLDIGTRQREGRLTGAVEAANGDIWLVTANGQLCRFRDGHMDVWGPIAAYCRSLALETNGTLWIATGQELIALDSTAVVSRQNLPPPRRYQMHQVDYLLTSRSGGFWLLANNKVQKIRGQAVERDFGFYPWTDAAILSACEDLAGNLVVGTLDRGLTWFDADGRAQTLTSDNGLSHGTAQSLLVDREGSLWVGTDGGGVDRVKRHVFEVLPATASKTVQSVCEDAAGGLWVGIAGGRTARLKDGELREFGPEEGLVGLGRNREPNSSAVFVDRQQQVWVGTRDFGLFELVKDRFQPVNESRLTGPNVSVSVLYEDRAGGLWAGTQSGLARRTGDHWEFMTNGLAAETITAVANDTAGHVWVGTANGLFLGQDGLFSPVQVASGFPGGQISAVLADAEGAVWVGIRARGLARFAGGSWTHFSKREGLPDNSIKYIADDRQGALWIGSSVGLVRVEKQDLNDFAADKTRNIRWRVYNRADGLLKDECSSGSQPAAWRGREGRMWFATTLGLVSVNPGLIHQNTNPPPVVIERVFLDDILQNTNQLRAGWPGRVTIPAGKERLEIRYTSLNLSAPDQARFKYQLEGHDSGWTDAGTDRSVRYPRLPPGDYRFRVTACNEDGIWNNAGAVLAITVEPPFWRKWWFLTLSAAILLGAIVATVHLISTQKLQRQLAQLRQKEALEKERARIARDLHDQLGANLTQVSLLGEMVESDKHLPDEVEGHARQISQTARATAHALDEIVWAANPANDTLEGLATYACKYAQEYFALAGLTHRLEVPDQLPATPVPPDVRHNVFLAFKESVNNVVKHAQATAVKVRLTFEAGRFTFEIEDNGRGLPVGAENKGRNGLRNMRKRMEDVGGEFSVSPAPPHGTRVRLTAPIRNH